MKTFSLSLCLILSISIAHAQKVYFKLGGGYALPVASQTIGMNYYEHYNSSTEDYTVTEEAVTGSFGAGVHIQGGVGVMFSKHLGFDLNFEYLNGKSHEQTYRRTNSNVSGKDETVHKMQASAIYLNPSFLITAGTGTVAPYGRIGIVIASPKLKSETSEFNNVNSSVDPYTSSTEWKYKKGTALGFQGAVGVNFAINNNFDIYAEVNFISMSYGPKEGNMTKSVTNGVEDDLAEMDLQDKKIEFKKEIDTGEYPDPNQPQQVLRQPTPFSSVALQVGVKYTLGGRSAD
jgi:hypothetical protein